jgi:hypothetical protein
MGRRNALSMPGRTSMAALAILMPLPRTYILDLFTLQGPIEQPVAISLPVLLLSPALPSPWPRGVPLSSRLLHLRQHGVRRHGLRQRQLRHL